MDSRKFEFEHYKIMKKQIIEKSTKKKELDYQVLYLDLF